MLNKVRETKNQNKKKTLHLNCRQKIELRSDTNLKFKQNKKKTNDKKIHCTCLRIILQHILVYSQKKTL